jgi:hypothetical protein
MAKRIDPSNLTVDFRQLMRMTVQDRVDFYKSGGQSYFESLTPTQLAQLFPKYYQRQLPDIGKAVSGGTAGTMPSAAPEARTGSGVTSGALGRAARSQQAPGQPQQSPPAQRNAFLEHLEKITGKPSTQQQNTQAGPLVPDKNDAIDPTQFRTSMMNRIRNSGLIGFVPPDGEKYGIKKGTAAEWANYFTGLAKHESGLKTKTHGDVGQFGGHGSRGLFQLSPQDAITYGIQNKPFTYEQLQDPNFNADVALKIHEYWLLKKRQGIQEGAGRYWGPISKEGWTPGKGRDRNLPWNEWNRQESDSATSVQKPEQERPSQSGMPTGLRPSDAAPGKTERKPGQASGEEDLYGIAQTKRKDTDFGGFKRSNSNCGRGTGAVVDAIFGTDYTKGGIGANAGAFAGRNPRPFIPQLYSGPAGLPEGYMNDPSQWRIGDVVAAQGGDGHIQVWNGKQWVSDFKQKGILPGYSGYILHRVKPEAYSQVSSEYAKNMDQGGNTRNFLSGLGIEFGTAPVLGVDKPEEANRERITKPQEYDSWNPNLKKYIESLPPTVQQKIFEQANLIKQNNLGDINQIYETAIKQNPNAFSTAPKVVTDAVMNAPPGEMPQINPEGFGVGKIHGEQKYTPEQEAKRQGFTTGRIKFTGFEDTDLTQTEFQAGSGGREKDKPSVPSGTYSLTPQATGPVISDYYRSRGIDPNQGAFGRVYNVGTPKAPTVAGFDPKVQRTRTQIQIHSNVNRDVDKLISSGCITVSPEEYPRLVENIEKARKASKSGISLVVENNPDGTSNFTIMPSARATNPITVNTAVKNVQETGNIAGIPQATPEQQPTQTGTPPTQVITPSPQITGSAVPQPVTPAAPSVPSRASAAPQQQAPAAPQQQAQAAPQQQAPAAPQQQAQAAPQQQAPAAPTATATPVQEPPPRQEDQVKQNAVGGQEQTTENIGFFDTNTGKTLGTASRGEVVALNQSGIAEIKPEQRISEIPQMRTDTPQQQQQEQQQSLQQEQPPMPTNMAAMSSAPSVPSAQETFYANVQPPLSDCPASFMRACAVSSFENKGTAGGNFDVNRFRLGSFHSTLA